MKRPTKLISKINHCFNGEFQDVYDYILFLENLTKTQRTKTIDNAEKLLDKIAPDIVAEIKCDDGEIRNRPLIDIARVYEIFEQMKGVQDE